MQTFAPHTHDGYALSVIERGAQRFAYRGAGHVADEGSLVAIHRASGRQALADEVMVVARCAIIVSDDWKVSSALPTDECRSRSL